MDEEQRFGVAHKERLKQLKKRVDVSTLLATPIPRTLNMSLMGLRDMSVIETPPRDRLAIQTQVVQFSESVIKSAVELELGRGGQVFFIHNRVETIETIAALVRRLVPQARLSVAHGQMNEKEMEQAMLDFVAYKGDVLVATTIIENGIDIPRANTIIINRADHYGLSQLYQLRGRVGRSNRRAYAYLLIPSEAELTPIARRRLAAIREFSDLGAGFRVAALDLELRGAGNLLGGEQSGHMDALGFDLYTQMLERTVAELRGDDIEDQASVSINLGVDVAIPEDYVSDMGQRLRTYKRIASAREEETLAQIDARPKTATVACRRRSKGSSPTRVCGGLPRFWASSRLTGRRPAWPSSSRRRRGSRPTSSSRSSRAGATRRASAPPGSCESRRATARRLSRPPAACCWKFAPKGRIRALFETGRKRPCPPPDTHATSHGRHNSPVEKYF